MPTGRYVAWSVVSGMFWGLVALAVIAVVNARLADTWGGAAAAPLIGLLVGIAVRPAHRWRTAWKAVAYVASFYLGVALFGLASGVPSLIDASAERSLTDVLLAPVAFVAAVTIYPFWVLLVPLAVANGYLLGRIDEAGAAPRG